jgi:hypothetical protein
VRKVKCDEGWPACRACVSTGRVCDGYGIWGGGGNRYEQRRTGSVAPKPMKATQCHESVKLLSQEISFPPLIPVSTNEEHLHFQFFKEQTLAKLPGLYSRKYSNIWESLVIKACAEEPAVMHAVLGEFELVHLSVPQVDSHWQPSARHTDAKCSTVLLGTKCLCFPTSKKNFSFGTTANPSNTCSLDFTPAESTPCERL